MASEAGDRAGIVETMVAAYRAGLFPMSDPETGRLGLYEADPRAVMPLTRAQGLHVPRRLARVIRSGRFEVTSDRAFGRVIRGCAEPRRITQRSHAVSNEPWIDGRIIRIYEMLHHAGVAHSIEAWREDPDRPGARAVVGGIYGVRVGAMFAAESMYHDAARGGTDAGKVCLIRLIEHLDRLGFALLDVQASNPLLERFGCFEISKQEFQARLAGAVDRRVPWMPITP